MLCSSPAWCQVWTSIRLATTSASTVSTGESLFFFHWATPWIPLTMMEQMCIRDSIWRGYEDLADDVRYTPQYQKLYKRRKAVSYTHLDVYKRQFVPCARS